jgi:predicted nucleic acid-binding protein
MVLYNGTNTEATIVELVVDASAVMAVLLEEPERGALIAATQGRELVAPPSLPWEIGNGLVAVVRRKRLSQAEALSAWTAWGEVRLRLIEVDVSRALALAFEHDLYAYDAYLLALAEQRRIPLLTLDRTLQRAARDAGVTLLEI